MEAISGTSYYFKTFSYLIGFYLVYIYTYPIPRASLDSVYTSGLCLIDEFTRRLEYL